MINDDVDSSICPMLSNGATELYEIRQARRSRGHVKTSAVSRQDAGPLSGTEHAGKAWVCLVYELVREA